MEIACFRKIKTNKFLVFNTPAHALYFDVEKMKKKRNTGCQIYIPLNNVGKSAENERCTGCSFLKTKVKGSYAETLYF